MFKKTIASIAIIISVVSFAHEGHDLPGTIKANHGGVVKPGREINLEFVVSGSEVKLFSTTHDGKELVASEVSWAVTAKLPKGKPEFIKTELKDGVTIIKVDFKNAYRVELSVETENQGKKSKFKFQVEK